MPKNVNVVLWQNVITTQARVLGESDCEGCVGMLSKERKWYKLDGRVLMSTVLLGKFFRPLVGCLIPILLSFLVSGINLNEFSLWSDTCNICLNSGHSSLCMRLQSQQLFQIIISKFSSPSSWHFSEPEVLRI